MFITWVIMCTNVETKMGCKQKTVKKCEKEFYFSCGFWIALPGNFEIVKAVVEALDCEIAVIFRLNLKVGQKKEFDRSC